MIKLNALLVLPIALAFAGACDAKKADDKKGDAKTADAKKDDAKKEEPAKEEAKEEEPAKEEAAAVEPSPDMKSFLSGFDGTSDKVAAQLEAFASTDELKKDDMGMWNLKDPKVIAAEGDCFTFEAGSGMMVRTYDVCWEGGKIKSIADKGSK